MGVYVGAETVSVFEWFSAGIIVTGAVLLFYGKRR